MTKAVTFFIIAGESSGDRLGAALMRDMRETFKGELEFVGIGGNLMAEQGLNSIFPMDELSVMGVAEVIPKIRNLLKRIKQTSADVVDVQPTALITIDSPDFCFRVARRVKRVNPNIPIIHYVAPSVWAWRPKRAAKIAKYVDHVLALLPFEPPYMHAEGMSCDFVGHPITAEKQAGTLEIEQFKRDIGVDDDAKLICVLPGSRSAEVAKLGPVFLEVVDQLRAKFPDLKVVIPSVPSRVDQLRAIFGGSEVEILDPRGMSADAAEARKRTCFAASDVALAASGTVSLELAAANTPMVIAYKMHWLTASIKRRLVRISSATLVNILTDTDEIPEFLLEDCTVDKIYPAVKRLLENPKAADQQRRVSQEAIGLLRQGKGETGGGAAKSVLNFLQL